MSVGVCIVVVTAVFIFVFRPFMTTRGRVGHADAGCGDKKRLVEGREVLYDTIRELDFDYRMGKVEEDDYRATRSRFGSRAVELIKAIEETDAPAPGIEDRIEREIAAVRKKDTATCARCGSTTPAGARFCPQCGKALAESRP